MQEKAWMDSVVMLKWIETILQPYVTDTLPAGIRPLLLLDSYRCHLMGSIVSKINDLGVDVEHIPGGCTGLCQPIDVGVGKPFKTRVRKAWEEWMLEKVETSITVIPTPTRREVTDWVLQGVAGFTGTRICYNSWRHGEYSYFPCPAMNSSNRNDSSSASITSEGNSCSRSYVCDDSVSNIEEKSDSGTTTTSSSGEEEQEGGQELLRYDDDDDSSTSSSDNDNYHNGYTNNSSTTPFPFLSDQQDSLPQTIELLTNLRQLKQGGAAAAFDHSCRNDSCHNDDNSSTTSDDSFTDNYKSSEPLLP